MTILEIPYQYIQRTQQIKIHSFGLNHEQYLAIKRVIDLIFCVFAIPVLIIPCLLIALLIMIDSPGNPIFIQERAGYRGKKFKFYKFRTLWNDYESEEDRKFMQTYIGGGVNGQYDGDDRVAKFKPLHDKDVTRVGKLLRKTSLDELPQIINVIRGEMTLVGPRPNVLWEVEVYQQWHHDRMNVQPGLTGLAQVLGRSDISFDDIVRYDIQYAKNQSLHVDSWILIRTVKAILNGNGAG
jgi:lipopolysaccharide/colanic/teichoic acid biosynthesis glycosyltransferase